MEGFSRALIALAIILIILAFSLILLSASWLYTSAQIAAARSHGVYDSAEQAMLALVDSNYAGVSRVAILYAGPNSFDGSKPYVWYVIVRPVARTRP